jgi:hypothetical protein
MLNAFLDLELSGNQFTFSPFDNEPWMKLIELADNINVLCYALCPL